MIKRLDLIEHTLKGEKRAIARLMSIIEDDGPQAREALAQLYPHSGQAHIVGVTGATGTGKSTLVNEMAKEYRRRDKTVGIVAVDPTSPFSGGAFLGDRIRMRDLFADPGIFIRSMATRGSLGGLARATADVVKVLDAAGYQVIFVETVGAGQVEVDIAKMAHTVIVVEAPGLGDEVQAIKAGIPEIADIFVVNKADREDADKTALALQMMLDLNLSAKSSGASPDQEAEWRPPIHKTTALHGEGVGGVVAAIEGHLAYLQESGELQRRERERAATELENILRHELMRSLFDRVEEDLLEEFVDRVAQRELDPYSAAEMLLKRQG